MCVAKAEAEMQKLIRAWLKCPAEKRPSASALGHSIEQAAQAFLSEREAVRC